MHYGQCSFAVGRKSKARCRIESTCIRSFSGRNGGHDFPGVSVYDGHHFIVATDKKPARLRVYRKPGRFRTRSERPAMQHRQLPRINVHELGFVFDVDVHRAFAIGGCKFKFASHWNCADNFPVGRINRGDIAAASIHREHALCRRIENDCVRICSRGNRAERLQRF